MPDKLKLLSDILLKGGTALYLVDFNVSSYHSLSSVSKKVSHTLLLLTADNLVTLIIISGRLQKACYD